MSKAKTDAAADYIYEITGNIAYLDFGKVRSRKNQIEFTLIDADEIKIDSYFDEMLKEITKNLSVKPDKVMHHHGAQYTWNLPRGRRVAVQDRLHSDPRIMLMQFSDGEI